MTVITAVTVTDVRFPTSLSMDGSDAMNKDGGLCELVQHLSIFDYVAVSGALENRVTEYVDHLHEHFVDTCIVTDGAYRLPTAPGYSAEMMRASVEEFRFPDGHYWSRAAGSRVPERQGHEGGDSG